MPEFPVQPEFEWIQRGAHPPRDRRIDYRRSVTALTPLEVHRKPGLGKKNIDQDIYLRRQDEENRRACRHEFQNDFYVF